MGKHVESPVSTRVSPELKRHLEQHVRQKRTVEGSELTRSDYIRTLLEVEDALTRRSPYICTRANHFVFITATGDVLYHRAEDLHFRTRVKRILAKLSMKSEKRQYFTQKTLKEVREAWLLNYFALWSDAPKLVASGSDPTGLSTKMVVFDRHNLEDASLVEGTRFTREGFFLLQDYGQFFEHPSNEGEDYDRVDILIDIPTEELNLTVVIDVNLYKQSLRYGSEYRESPRVELRNREEVKFTSAHSIGTILDRNFFRRIASYYPLPKGSRKHKVETATHIKATFSTLEKRLKDIASESPSAFSEEFTARTLQRFKFPREYLFEHIKWTWPHIGFYLSPRWAKPDRPSC